MQFNLVRVFRMENKRSMSNRDKKDNKHNKGNKTSVKFKWEIAVEKVWNETDQNVMTNDKVFKINKKRCLRKKTDDLDTFHRAISPILVVSQFFALMPLVGVRNSDPQKVEFKAKSVSTCIVGIFIFTGIVNLIIFLNFLVPLGITPKNIVGLVFFSCGVISCILFTSLAKQWPEIITYWSLTEIKFLKSSKYKEPRIKLSRRIRLAALSVLILGACEHILFNMADIYGYVMYAKICNGTDPPGYDDYMSKRFGYVYNVITYNKVFSVYVVIINVTYTYIWNFMDFFIMMVSLGISIRFEQINHRLHDLTDLILPELVWMDIRKDYVKLIELLEFIDEKLSSIVLLSCMNNLYFICFQLLNIFTKLPWTISYIYFWYSLIYLIGRTIFIFLCASSINDQAVLPLKALRRLPSNGWNTEVERFIMDVKYQCPALSGKKFYFITRKLLLKLIGTVVTYELVLLQFDEPNRRKGPAPLCG